MNPWLAFSLILFGIWLVLFILRKENRKEMLWVSILTAPFGLTEPLFVPEYWNPSSLFNLAATTGFDIESLIFSFAIGGIGAVLYEAIFRMRHLKISKRERHTKKHRFHVLALLSPIIVFLPLQMLTNLNPIYSASISMFIGGTAAILCRPDLKKKILIGGILFLGLYFVFFLFFNLVYPLAVSTFWNLPTISGILILGVPLEELLFAFTFGMLWSSYYEHIKWFRLNKLGGKNNEKP
ncbi:MAG: lycopene cyclase domain-containing protein [Nanoarchaeota archaeon]|nr:lycopene cyclase domain-containing protein [Nanoarchaeota archaeon]